MELSKRRQAYLEIFPERIFVHLPLEKTLSNPEIEADSYFLFGSQNTHENSQERHVHICLPRWWHLAEKVGFLIWYPA